MYVHVCMDKSFSQFTWLNAPRLSSAEIREKNFHNFQKLRSLSSGIIGKYITWYLIE